MISRRSLLAGGSAAIVAGAAPRSAWGRTQAEVIVIGAGLAGLHAARLLELAGLRTIILEGEQRVGGRLHTLDDLPGRPDAGGIQIGAGYRRLRAVAAELGVPLDEGPGGGAGAVEARTALFNIAGQTVPAADWPDSPVNRLGAEERRTLPLALAFSYAARLPRLETPEAWMSADPGLDISYAEALRRVGASAEAMRLIEVNMNGNTLAGMSQLSIARSSAIFRAGPGPTATVRGGSQRLPEAMAGRLSSPIRLGTLVSGIREDVDGVTVETSRGRLKARHVICTIPFSTLRYISLEASLPQAVATMIASLPYTRASFAYLSATEPFWKADGQPETLWTDDPMLGRVFVLGSDPPMLKVWTVGAGADLLDRAPAELAGAEIISRIERARPSAQGKLKLERLFSWQKRPLARGIYHHIGTGQAALLAQAVRSAGARLHFAGEHLSEASSGMEGAFESAERVARRIVQRA
jgi:monoamine oxidase